MVWPPNVLARYCVKFETGIAAAEHYTKDWPTPEDLRRLTKDWPKPEALQRLKKDLRLERLTGVLPRFATDSDEDAAGAPTSLPNSPAKDFDAAENK